MGKKKKQPAPFVGIASHYKEYRHGNPRGGKIYVPGSKRSPGKPLNKDGREVLVTRTAEVLRGFKFSRFEFEGACRAGLRSALCLAGNSWQSSDNVAADVVHQALSSIGAKRPTWIEGQPHYSISLEYCAWCAREIDDPDAKRAQRFCSADCAKSFVQHRENVESRKYDVAVRAAHHVIDRDKAEPRPCHHCGKAFKTDAKHSRFCSLSCAATFAQGDRARQDRNCLVCGTQYHPLNSDQECCSLSCRTKLALRREAEQLIHLRRRCSYCEEVYTPHKRTQEYCSRECQIQQNRERGYARKRVSHNPRPCKWCGNEFVPGNSMGQFCSSRCSKDASRFSDGSVPKNLTWRIFDRYISTPLQADAA